MVFEAERAPRLRGMLSLDGAAYTQFGDGMKIVTEGEATLFFEVIVIWVMPKSADFEKTNVAEPPAEIDETTDVSLTAAAVVVVVVPPPPPPPPPPEDVVVLLGAVYARLSSVVAPAAYVVVVDIEPDEAVKLIVSPDVQLSSEQTTSFSQLASAQP